MIAELGQFALLLALALSGLQVALGAAGRIRRDSVPRGAAEGLFDTADERVDANVATVLPPGPHLVTVRAVDAAGNASLAETEAH